MAEKSWMAMIRHERQMTQLQLAEQAGIARPYLTQIELGVRLPSIKVAMRLGEAFQVPWTRWFEEPINPTLME